MTPPSTRYADSPIRRLDARVKLAAFAALVVASATTPPGSFLPYAGYGAILAAVAMAARLRPRELATRAAVAAPVAVAALVIPFVHAPEGPHDLLVGFGFLHLTWTGLELGASILAKMGIGVASILILGATTPFPELVAGLERLRLPPAFVSSLGFLYRFLFVLTDEARRMVRARDSRCYGGRWLWQAGVIGHMVGTLFLRAYERAERIHAAMLARGYADRPPARAGVALAATDYAFLGAMVAVTLFFRMPLG